MQNIRAIIFDLGGVILDISFELTKVAFEQLGIEHFEKMYSLKDANPLFQKLEEGKVSEEEFYESFRRSCGKNLSDEEIRDSWNSLLLEYRTGTLNALKNLRKKYKLYLLSNTNTIHWQAFTKIFDRQIKDGSLNEFFDKAYYSFEIGLRKPDLPAYEYVLKENNLNPAETLFIDDSLQNIEAAKQLGLQVIHLTSGMRIEQLEL